MFSRCAPRYSFYIWHKKQRWILSIVCALPQTGKQNISNLWHIFKYLNDRDPSKTTWQIILHLICTKWNCENRELTRIIRNARSISVYVFISEIYFARFHLGKKKTVCLELVLYFFICNVALCIIESASIINLKKQKLTLQHAFESQSTQILRNLSQDTLNNNLLNLLFNLKVPKHLIKPECLILIIIPILYCNKQNIKYFWRIIQQNSWIPHLHTISLSNYQICFAWHSVKFWPMLKSQKRQEKQSGELLHRHLKLGKTQNWPCGPFTKYRQHYHSVSDLHIVHILIVLFIALSLSESFLYTLRCFFYILTSRIT